MLQSLVKYNTIQSNKSVININFRKNYNKSYNTKYKQLYLYKYSAVFSVGLFSRKAFFRNLLTYANMQYSNLNLIADSNWFYYPKTVLAFLTMRHSSFLFKKRFLK